jgi:hypothetical protein
MDKRATLTLVISLCCGILVLLWFAWSQITRTREENFRAAVLKDLGEATRTYDSLSAQTATTKKHYELYQAAIGCGTVEDREKSRRVWAIGSEQQCELEVLLRRQVATIEKKS